MKLISTKTHGVLDYLTAGTLLALPRALGWGERVTGLMTTAALGTLGYSLMTRYELGLVKVLPMRTHLWLDGMNGAMFCAAPFLFHEEDSAVTKTLVGIGLFELGASLLTETEPRSEVQGRRLAREQGQPYPSVSQDYGDRVLRSSTASNL